VEERGCESVVACSFLTNTVGSVRGASTAINRARNAFIYRKKGERVMVKVKRQDERASIAFCMIIPRVFRACVREPTVSVD
jgi:hypothetical protein